MATDSLLYEVWSLARTNDIPNWFALAFTAVLWPVALLLWQRRKVAGVPGLEVNFTSSDINIDGKPYKAVAVRFTNHTGSVTYISGVRVSRCTDAFPVPIEAARDVAGNSYHLKFQQASGAFDMREITLQTGETAASVMPATASLSVEFFNHAPTWFSRRIGLRKYFDLDYTAMVGTARFSIRTHY
jgi:hypothetical protein